MNNPASKILLPRPFLLLPVLIALAIALDAQAPAASPATTAQASAPIDLTGYWVSIVTEDWRWRMVTPAKGEYASVPITPEAKRIADQWDPAKDEAAGEQCKSYGAAAIMRVPERIHITWQDANTLKVETDAGMQTRLFHFGKWPAPKGDATWQGDSVALWETPRPAGRGAPDSPPPPAKFGDMKVDTTHLRAGYLRKNGIPYSSNTKMTEYWDLNHERGGDQWIVITTVVDDPANLQVPWVTDLLFKKEKDGSKWDPTPCSARW